MRLVEDFVSRVKIVHVSSPVFLSLGVSNTCRFRVLEIFFFSLFSHNTRTTSTLIRNFSNLPSILCLSRTLPVIWPTLRLSFLSVSLFPLFRRSQAAWRT